MNTPIIELTACEGNTSHNLIGTCDLDAYKLLTGSEYTLTRDFSTDKGAAMIPMTTSVIAVIVMGCLVLVLGLVYTYLYCTRIHPKGARARSYHERSAITQDGEDEKVTHTHLFLFKR